ncbi:MAG TPA: hypothetical protein VNG93_11155 [Candidatus Dormibacteraeota bacterium]|nr:hypothetical protein [Candidatus Dormibacteraeota bacterium]
MDDPALGFDVLAASLRADARDLELFLEVLAAKLGDALPGRVGIDREGGLLSRKRVKRVAVDLGEHRYELARAPGGLAGRHSHQVRGITLKTEQLPVEDWITALSRHLVEEARSSEQGRLAMQRLIGA